VQHGDVHVDPRLQPVGHQVGGLGNACGIVRRLPLADAQDNREARSDTGADCGDELCSEARLSGNRGDSVAIAAQIGAALQELIDQIAMCAIEFDRVETEPLCLSGRLGEGGDRIGDVLGTHRFTASNGKRTESRGLSTATSGTQSVRKLLSTTRARCNQ